MRKKLEILAFICLLCLSACVHKPQYVANDARLLDMCEAFTLLVYDAKNRATPHYGPVRQQTFMRYTDTMAMGDALLDIIRETQYTMTGDPTNVIDLKISDTVDKMENALLNELKSYSEVEYSEYLTALFEKHRALYDFLDKRH
ncbi:MAG: hypothetical protein IJU65_09570 [Desulfovibrio sp.]|nr:hypothetical protein [Desulfovibrio sp.]